MRPSWPLALALAVLHLAAPAAAQETAEEAPWAAGEAWLEARRKAQSDLVAPEVPPHRLERIDSEDVRWAFPEHRFYRIEMHLEYAKPGLRWIGTLYALARGAAEPTVLCDVGLTTVAEAEERLVALGGPALRSPGDAVRFDVALAAILCWFERPEAHRQAERVEGGWRVAAPGLPDLFIEVDESDRPRRIVRR